MNNSDTNQSDMNKSDQIRAAALEHADKTERLFRYATMSIAGIEGLALAIYITFMDFAESTHILILVAAVMTYTQIGAGLFFLGRYIKVSTLQVLKAIEIEHDQD